MAKTWLEKEIWLTTKNEVGTLAKLTAPLAEAKVNIWALCAWVEGDTAKFAVITDNNTEAVKLWKTAGYTTTENEAVVTELEDKPGTTWTTAQTLSGAGIDVKFMYVTTCGGCPTTRAILHTSNNSKAVTLLG